MIHGLLDFMQPDASDDEDDERQELRFEFQIREAAAPAEADAAAAIKTALSAVKPQAATVRPEACSALVLCGPGAGHAYALSCFELKPMPWAFEVVKESVKSQVPPPPRSPKFFVAAGAGAASLAGPVAVAFLEAQLSPEMAESWIEALLAAFKGATEVVLLDRVYRAGWFAAGGGEKPQEPHLCGLWSAAWGAEAPLAQVLPAPNSIEGLGAALLTECEVAQRKGLVALALQDGAHLAEGSLHAFSGLTSLFRRLALMPEGAFKPKYTEALKQVVAPLAMSIYA